MTNRGGDAQSPPPGHPAVAGQDWRMLIGGALVPALDGAEYTTTNPANGHVLAKVPDAGAADVERAVGAAEVAQDAWRRATVEQRCETVLQFGARIAEVLDELAILDALDSGNPVTAMRSELDTAVQMIRLYAGWSDELYGRQIPRDQAHLHFTRREPFGIVGRIIPFNHPTLFATTKIIPPLLAGNPVILKVAPQTPLSALRIGQIASEVFPPGVLAVLTGSGLAAGDAVVRHPLIRRIGFTGSPAAGMAIQRAAAETCVKSVTLELGGKNALIAYPDADLDLVAQAAVRGMNFTVSQGQSCGSTSRVLVHESRSEDLVSRMKCLMEKITVGDPVDPSTEMGPLVSQEQLDKSLSFVDDAISAGARLVTGGSRCQQRGLAGGFFMPPTLMADVRTDMHVAQEEVFGPVVSVMPIGDMSDAVTVANSTSYGLTASVWTADLSTALSSVAELEAGYVWVNNVAEHFWGMPFGGCKNSGVGREECAAEIASYTYEKSVNVTLRP